jgi:hypothetical protein
MEYLAEPYEIIDRPLWWHKAGKQQTRSGYGSKLNTGRCVRFPDGTTRRIYVTCYSNAGTAWIVLRGKRVYLPSS